MQDSGQRDPKGRFVKGGVGNPYGRKGRMDASYIAMPVTMPYSAQADQPSEPVAVPGVRLDNLPGEYIEPEKVLNLIRMDGWQNVSTGVGVPGFDKRLNTRFITEIVSYRDAVEMWRGDDIAARVVETLPKEALKKGWELNIFDEGEFEDLKDMVEQVFDELEINENLESALKFERAYGGGALLIGANDGQDMSMPLNMDSIIDLQWVTPLEPIELSPLQSYGDPFHPKHGKPELYLINAISQGPVAGMADPMSRVLPPTSVIHESRLIIFPGTRVSKFQNKTGVGGIHWGDSVFTRFIRVLADFNLGYSSTGIILTEQGLPVFSMKELAKLVNQNKMDVVKARLSLLFQQMSTARAAVIDSEEKYERMGMPLTGLPETLDRLATRMAAAVEMPVTKLMGQSPKGLGNEGESDMEQWYDNVASYQKAKVRRHLRRLIQIVIRALRHPEPQKWSVKFHPLKQMSEEQLAQARSTQAQTDVAYITAGVLSAEDVRKSRFSGEYSFETTVDFEAYEEMDAISGQPLSPEDMMAMGLDPTNPDHVAQAQALKSETAGAAAMGGDPAAVQPPMGPGLQAPPGEPGAGSEEPVENPFAAKAGFGEEGIEDQKPLDAGTEDQKPLDVGTEDQKPPAPKAGESEDTPAPKAGESEDTPAPKAEGYEPEKAEPKKEGGGGRSGMTDKDRQRMVSSMPGLTHIADRNGDGKVTPKEAEITIEEILQRIKDLKAIMAGGQPVPVVQDEEPLVEGEEQALDEDDPDDDPDDDPEDDGGGGNGPAEDEERKDFDEDQPRDESGRWSETGAGGGSGINSGFSQSTKDWERHRTTLGTDAPRYSPRSDD